MLLSICKSAPFLNNEEVAERLLRQISRFLAEAHIQEIAPSPTLRTIEPSPWEALTYQLASAILVIGIKYPSLHSYVLESTLHYLWRISNLFLESLPIDDDSIIDHGEMDMILTHRTAVASTSLLGFLEAISLYAHFYNATESVEVVGLLQQILSNKNMVLIEGAFSSIRTAESLSKTLEDWRLHLKRYAASGRPLGYMLLQQAVMRFLVSCSSLQLSTPEELQCTNHFKILLPEHHHLVNDNVDSYKALIQAISDMAVEGMRLLINGADYQLLGSAWQQRLAFVVKAHTVNVFMNCMIADESIASADTLMSWLEESVVDPIQMADKTLAGTVLRSMAVIAAYSSSAALTLSRALPKFIVQGNISAEMITAAAHSLTYILRLLSQDAIITCLYSLGNILSARTGTENQPESSLGLPSAVEQYSQQSSISAISLDFSGNDEATLIYENVIRAIVKISSGFDDPKITALALSMLIQKLGRLSLTVDLLIIKEAAILAGHSEQQELRALLKLYSKLSHNAIVEGNTALSEAVRK